MSFQLIFILVVLMVANQSHRDWIRLLEIRL